MSLNNAYVRSIDPKELLDGGRSAREIDAVDFTKPQKSTRKGEASFRVSSPTTIYGFALWWIADLGGGIALSTAPGAPRTHWEQLYFPLLEPIAAVEGDQVILGLRSRSSEESGTHLAWTATHEGKTGRQESRQALDLDKGYLP
jgi:protein arginine N-methyltransferase 1